MTDTERLLAAGDALADALTVYAEAVCQTIVVGRSPAAALLQVGVLQLGEECLRKHDAWRALARELKGSKLPSIAEKCEHGRLFWARCHKCEVKEQAESPAQLVASAVQQGTKNMGFTPSDAERRKLAAKLFSGEEKRDDA